MLKYSQLNWAEQVLSNNCFHHTQDIIIINCSREYLKNTRIPLYSSHIPFALGKPNIRIDVPAAKLKKKLFTYKKHQRKRNVNIHKNLLLLVDKIQTSPPVLPLPKKMSISSTSNETSHQVKIIENITEEPYTMDQKEGKILVQTISIPQSWPSLYDDFPLSNYDQDLLAFSDLSIMCLLLLTNILQTDKARWLSTIYPPVEPEIPFAVYDFVSKVIERTGFEFGPGSFLTPPNSHKSHYTIDAKDANHIQNPTNEYVQENNEITRQIKKMHKKSNSGTSLLKWVKKKEDKKMSNDSDTSINTLQSTTVSASTLGTEKKSKKDKTIKKLPVKTLPFDVFCEERVINKVIVDKDISVQYTERSCHMPMETSVKKPSTIIAASFAGLSSVLLEWLQSKQPKIDHAWYDITPLLAACCSSNLTSPECVAVLLQSGSDQMRGIRLGLYALVANLGEHLNFELPVKKELALNWPEVANKKGKVIVDYTLPKIDWTEPFVNEPVELAFETWEAEHCPVYTIKRIPRVVIATQECKYLNKYASHTLASPQKTTSSIVSSFKSIAAMNIHTQVLPLDIACSRNNWSILVLLLKNSTSAVKHSSFALLVHQNVGVNAVLLKYNANIQMRTETGCTMLHLAARNGNINMCLLGLINGLNVNDQDNLDQFTPLHEAMMHGHVECVQLLLWMGADPFLISTQGESVIAMAHHLFGKPSGTWIEIVIKQREVVVQWEVFKSYFGRLLLI